MPVAADSSDAELMSAMADGLQALDLLYERHRTLAYSIAQRITRDHALSDDVVQEAFLGVWRNAHRYDPSRGSVKTWLMAMVHNRSIDALRRRKPVSELPDADLLQSAAFRAPDVWAEVSAGLDAAAVRRALEALTIVQREAIELAYFSGLTQQEVSDRTGAPLGTVKSRMRLGLLAMRRAMIVEDAVA